MRKIAAGFTLVEIMIVVAIIALLAVLAVPSFMRSRVSARTNSCINNLRLIDHAKEMWAASNSRSLGDAVDTTAVNTYLRIVPQCPSGGTYTYQPIGTLPTCNYGGSNHVMPTN